MNLESLRLQNYRRFADFEIDFDPELTVIAARNGQGKTTILEAIAAAFGPFVGAFDMGKSKHIERTDARYVCIGDGYENEQKFPVVVDAQMRAPGMQWQRALLSAKSRTTTKEAAPLANWGKDLQSQLRNDAGVELPLVAYYSSRRLWVSHKNTSSKAVLTESRTAGYEDCLSSLSNYIQLQQWMRKATYAVIQQREQPGYALSNLEPRLQGIRNAVDQVLAEEGWSGFHYSLVFEDLAMSHPDHGALPLSLLSDGVRAMISLAADLAFRCARLNGQFKELAPQKTTGIVLIDEVDLHLHPAWQQRVIGSLRQAFPRFQFIVSSHSPQVLTTVSREQIRVVRRDNQGNWLSEKPSHSPLAQESGDALAYVMDVSPKPPLDVVTKAHAYEQLVRSGKGNEREALSLKSELDAQGYEIPQAQAALWAFLAEQAGKQKHD
ncbi:TPA: AAA family ATPase [Pseudomonas aeruginosa]|uniref:AAA family ATPase n=1 Tax=Pseudomonas aeruginosa TaxID=287 RepID=UPI000F523883|nr:AAA family ATPase [Pseudomonas aeruginosa]MBH9296378.1 AAA family ATPase [Pseudomonas aeruginosa]MDV7936870.1 AAA family ATPase [Pseudomonas aeruginosa]RPN75845.1 ATP-binding protein [Pseudomonas aeruginosa]HBN8410741.1 AAA family ATPase [Pseudomonas aeruginosa]HBN9541229.1 AAA family ATPase [Pseudomonas aeruginosa]